MIDELKILYDIIFENNILKARKVVFKVICVYVYEQKDSRKSSMSKTVF